MKLETLFRTERSKAIPCPAAHLHIGHIREYSPRLELREQRKSVVD